MDTVYRCVLTDVERGIWQDSYCLDGTSLKLGVEARWSVCKTTLHGGLRDGIDLIEVDNGVLSFAVIPTRGMGLWKGRYHEIPVGWKSPVKGPVHPSFVDLNDRGGLGWLKGFDEWIVRCGLDSNGAPGEDVVIDNNGNEIRTQLALHGKIANLPAHYVEVHISLAPPHRIAVIGVVEEAMMFGPALRMTTCISTEIGSNTLTISDQVANLKSTPSELELLYHCNYGEPFLEEGARLVVPIREMGPRDPRALEDVDAYDLYGPPESGYVEQCYFFELIGEEGTGQTCVLLKNAAGNLAVSHTFSVKELPCFTLWKNTAAVEDGYVTGLEPATDYPNTRYFEREQNRLLSIPPGGQYTAELTVGVHDTQEAVEEQEQRIRRLQGSQPPKIHGELIPTFSPVV